MIQFTQIPDKLPYPSNIKSKLSTLHSAVVTYVISSFKNTNRYKTKVVSLLNTLSHYILFNDTLPTDWNKDSPFDNIEFVDQFICEEHLGNLYLHVKDIKWDVEEIYESSTIAASNNVNSKSNTSKDTVSVDFVDIASTQHKFDVSKSISRNEFELTPKESLFIKPPLIPQLDTSIPWVQKNINGTLYTIYKSLPEIPTMQSEISVTTDINKMTTADLTRLFPNHIIKTRSSIMYEPYGDLQFDEDLGVILPVTGFSPSQVRDNIIKYPHIFKLSKLVNGKFVSFYSTIEIDGKLHKTLDIWDSLPDSKKMPRNAEYIKEYVVRKYLLERDIKHTKHNYPMFGTLEPFLTLFATPDDYIKFGYSNTLDLAKACVNSRVSYKRSRNPVMRLVCDE